MTIKDLLERYEDLAYGLECLGGPLDGERLPVRDEHTSLVVNHRVPPGHVYITQRSTETGRKILVYAGHCIP